MSARWLFVLVFLAYLLGPSRAGVSEPELRTGPTLVALASAPVAAALRAIYPHVASEDRARWTGRLVCAACTAGAVAVLLGALLHVASPEAALLLALMAAFASPLWSWASRSDVSAAIGALLIASLLYVAITLERRVPLLALGAVGVIGTAALLGWPSLAGEDRFAKFDPGVLAAYLFSPGRGVVFYAPLVLIAAAALLRRQGRTRLAVAGATSWLVLLVAIAARPEPWGPLSFGPTLVAAYVPVLAIVAASLPTTWLRAGALLCLPAAAAHAAFVFGGGHTWDERRAVVDHPEAVWDIDDSPFSSLLRGAPRPDVSQLAAVSYHMTPGDHVTRPGHPLPWLAYGWEKPEPKGVWASGAESWIVLGAPPGEYVLTLVASGPKRRAEAQRLVVERPAEPPLEVTFTKALWELEPVSIPFRATENVSTLKLRPAHTWMPGHGDVRGLSVFVAALRLQRKAVGSVPVTVVTERGTIELVIDADRAPKTAANFLRYVDMQQYDGGVIHRTVKPDNQPDKKIRIEVIQGGVNPDRKRDGFPAIALERTRDTGLAHTDGTLSMARDGPDTATSDFFICIGDQPSLDFGGQRNPDGQGFAAFGRVVSGMDVVRKVQQSPADGQRLTPPVRILSMRRR